eukprot:m.25478 g.25478  ORF g.25478 m.25478 type:complete len:52 (+) comp5770_c0_seq1:189-344(+)
MWYDINDNLQLVNMAVKVFAGTTSNAIPPSILVFDWVAPFVYCITICGTSK